MTDNHKPGILSQKTLNKNYMFFPSKLFWFFKHEFMEILKVHQLQKPDL